MMPNQSQALERSKSSASLVVTLTNSKVVGVVVVISSTMKETPTAPWWVGRLSEPASYWLLHTDGSLAKLILP
jgi:hypothetical protein